MLIAGLSQSCNTLAVYRTAADAAPFATPSSPPPAAHFALDSRVLWHYPCTRKFAGGFPMRVCFLILCLFLACNTLAQQPPEIRFSSVPDFLKLPPDLYLGEATGVAVNSKGHIFVFSRGSTTGPAYAAAAAQLLEFAPDGKFVREIGHHLYAWSFAHTVKVDSEDNIWITDKGSDMVIKLDRKST